MSLRLRLTIASVLAVLCVAGHARAATLAGVTLPDTYTVDGRALALNGIALRTLTIFNVHVYVVGLYLEQPSHDAAAIMGSPGRKVILLQFVHSGSKEEIEKEYRQGEMNNCGHGECAASDKDDFERLVAAAPAVAVGDTSTYIFSPAGTRVLANNRVIASFQNPDLALRLLQGFIGAHPPSAELRTALLGGH